MNSEEVFCKALPCSDCRKTVSLKSRETRFFSNFVYEIENFEKTEQKVGRIIIRNRR